MDSSRNAGYWMGVVLADRVDYRTLYLKDSAAENAELI
jgi:hypothetical protein